MTKIKDAGVPVAMYVAKHDRIIYPVDSRWARDVLGSSVVDYQEIDGGHVTFMVGKDQTYFLDGALSQIRKYNPIN